MKGETAHVIPFNNFQRILNGRIKLAAPYLATFSGFPMSSKSDEGDTQFGATHETENVPLREGEPSLQGFETDRRGAAQATQHIWKLYGSHGLSAWGIRMWEFSIGLVRL